MYGKGNVVLYSICRLLKNCKSMTKSKNWAFTRYHITFLACKDPTKYVFEKCMKCTYKYVETTLWKIMAWNLNNNFPRDSTRFKSPLSKLRKDIWGIGFGHTSFFTWHFLKVKHPVLQRGNTIPYKSPHANENPHFKRGFDFIKCRIKNRCHTSD